VPEFHFKRDVFPHPRKNNQDESFQTTIDKEGAFVGRCAELCGAYHAMMNFEVRALSPDKFDRYMELRTQNNPQTGEPYTAAEALATMQDEGCDAQLCSPVATTTSPFVTDRTARTASG
jgi:cytochrome c oxidase subunit 2